MTISYNAANRFPAPCPVCKKMVPAGLGIGTHKDAYGKWWAHCSPCFQAQKARPLSAMEMPRVTVKLELDPDDRVGVRLVGLKTLPQQVRDRFFELGRAVGFFWVKAEDRSVGPFGAVPDLIKSFDKDGFHVEVDAALSEKLQVRAVGARQDIQAATRRAGFVDELLAKRSMKLYPYQRKTIDWLAPRETALIGHDPGLGKTIISLVALPEKVPVVIISPANAKGVWLREICNWRPDYGTCKTRSRGGLTYLEPDRGIKVLEGQGSFEWPNPGEVVILNYSILPVTPAEHEDSIALLNEWEMRGKPDGFKWTPPGSDEEEEVEQEHINKAERVVKIRPVTPPPTGTVLIADEAHNVKQRKGKRQSDRARRFRALAEYVRSNGGRTWTLTGTPLLNEPVELWAIMVATGCANQIFGSRKQFEDMFEKQGKSWKPKNQDRFAHLLRRCMFRYAKEDVLTQLPPKTREHVTVEIRPEDKRKLDKLLEEVEAAGKERLSELIEKEREKATKAHEKAEAKRAAKRKKDDEEEGEDEEDEDPADRLLGAQQKAQERMGDAFIPFEELSEVRTVVAQAKIPALFRIVKEYMDRGEKIIVFADHLEPVQFIYDQFGREAGGWALITGAVPAKKRSAIEESFQRETKEGGTLRGIAATIGAAGVALTLTKASTAIFIEENWVPAINIQAQDRIHRIGQFKAVTIKVLVADHPIDRMIADANARKIELVKKTIGAASIDPTEEIATVADEYEAADRIIQERREEVVAEEYEEAREAEIGEELERERPELLKAPPPRPAAPPARPAAPPTPAGFERTRDELLRLHKERGFTREDNIFGSSVASQLAARGTLTERQWAAAEKLVARYRGSKEQRAARTPVENWAAQGLVMLAASDPDRAREINDVGFSKFDNDTGHKLANMIESGEGLNDAQWETAIKLATRYRRQVGAVPGASAKNPRSSWFVVLTEPRRGVKPETGIIGPDDIEAFVYPKNGDAVPQQLRFPKALYTPEEAAGWAEAYGLNWLRVEG